MLVNLHVKNLAIIEEVDICFDNHLNILTGETGAGKSVILGSISLALGAKAPRDIIRNGAQYALVELIFEIEEKELAKKLAELDIYPEDGQVIISRRITEGKSFSKINGESVTLSTVRAAAAYLLDIHGQHEHQSLLYKQSHMELLDKYCGQELLLKRQELKEKVAVYKNLKREWEEGNIEEEKRIRELSFLEYEINEIEAAKIKPGEEEELTSLYKKLSNAERLANLLGEVYTLTEGDGAADIIGRAVRQLFKAVELDDGLSDLYGQLEAIEGYLNDFNRDLSSYLDDLVFDENTLRQTEERLDFIRTLMTKYGGTEEAIEQYYKEAVKKREKFYHYEEYKKELEEKIKEAEQVAKERSKELSEIRKKQSLILEKELRQALIDLNFLEVQFEIHFDTLKEVTERGIDDITFCISTNPGEPVRPLSAVASGGELSRIMLALKSVMAENDEIPTLIFDEIDVGISGRTAQKVSEKMAEIAKTHQVICITHLAQIAAMADCHFVIEKKVQEGTTVTKIRKLSEEESVIELTRILGGAEITESVKANAAEMKALAKQRKQILW